MKCAEKKINDFSALQSSRQVIKVKQKSFTRHYQTAMLIQKTIVIYQNLPIRSLYCQSMFCKYWTRDSAEWSRSLPFVAYFLRGDILHIKGSFIFVLIQLSFPFCKRQIGFSSELCPKDYNTRSACDRAIFLTVQACNRSSFDIQVRHKRFFLYFFKSNFRFLLFWKRQIGVNSKMAFYQICAHEDYSAFPACDPGSFFVAV